ncbi:MAG TPA: SEC-C metal-binding domain-containing protein, partial [Candidatus Bathyarchaeia archaeon]|nr:SEC-C metal-binding domain-containing protein [Candidatus Bathyarchaeia archaeon]
EDDLMRLFGGDRLMMIMDKMAFDEGQVLENPLLSRSIGVAQKRVETFNFEIRKQLIEYDNVMNKQREAVYGLRRSILQSDNIKDRVLGSVDDVIDRAINQYLYGGSHETEWDFDGLFLFLKTRFGCDLSGQREAFGKMEYDEVREYVRGVFHRTYEHKEQNIGSELMRHLEKMLMLNTIDAKWKDHLYAMDQLKGGVGLRSYGQRDPLLEYKKEGFEMFQAMFDLITDEVAELVYKAHPVIREQRPQGVFEAVPQNLVHHDFSSMDQARQHHGPALPPGPLPGSSASQPSSSKPIQRQVDKVGRNDLCPCGSGKKYKKCCGK